MCRELGERGATTVECAGGNQLRRHFAERRFDLLITELRLSDGPAIDVIEWLRDVHPQVRVAVVTAHSSIASVVRCTRLGVRAYLPKPTTTDCLLQALGTAPLSPVPLTGGLDVQAGPMRLDRAVWEYINRAVESEGSIARGAELLGVDRRSLRRMLTKYAPP
jgi:ActR/RegA family two-component response regulator